MSAKGFLGVPEARHHPKGRSKRCRLAGSLRPMGAFRVLVGFSFEGLGFKGLGV